MTRAQDAGVDRLVKATTAAIDKLTAAQQERTEL